MFTFLDAYAKLFAFSSHTLYCLSWCADSPLRCIWHRRWGGRREDKFKWRCL